MTIKNLDRQAKNEAEMKENLLKAMNSGDENELAEALTAFAKTVEANILQEARAAVNEDFNDQQVMIKRGLNPLTSEERKYYNEVITSGGFAGSEQLMPATVIDRVFEDLVQDRPLLKAIEFVNVTGVTEWITRGEDVQGAWWGPLTDEIKKELSHTFKKMKTDLYKLSAFIPVSKAMLDLGPQWLDRFVRTVLAESIALALEDAIVNGDGKNKPIGMLKDLAGAVVDGVYPDKDAEVLPDFKPGTLGRMVMAPLTKGGKRSVTNVILVVNPLDYWAKIFELTTVLTQSGTYVYGVLPIPGTIIQSVSVPEGKMVAGLAKDYFMGVGSTRKIEYSDEYRFLEDERVYVTKQYANGRPKDNESFLVFDISTLGETPAP
ncbi:phage major capsid protein [Peribacillus tepidiphilus]|uniref:phage major capsid protein n=1 Tax=Peribacillus tepidiphilus TaxID=2652445 RepID=UPI0012926C40|nr:phage major capsid protein [Peribacillus tepidiphilus]